MSRNILQTHEKYKEDPLNNTASGKVILTAYQNTEMAFLMRNNRLLSACVLDNASRIGAVYIGKVKNVVKNLNACFVEIANGELCFLSFGDAKDPFLLNREYDGRLLQGDEILVQLQRDALKTKQAALTCQVSQQSEYFVFTLGSRNVGISAKLSGQLKTEVKSCLQEHFLMDASGTYRQCAHLPDFGVVVRTSAGNLFSESRELFLQQLSYEEAAFREMLENAGHRTCFSMIKAPKTPYEAVLSTFRSSEYEEILTDLPRAYTSLQGYPKPLRLYEDTFSLSKLYSLETKMSEAMSKTVWLKSGANLVIEQTECLTSIDVNSGKMIKGTQNEEAIQIINAEAAREAALQIRLRNLSGIIIIDFINMRDSSARADLIKLMKELTESDNITTTVIDITPLGLMEITRKKVNRSLREQFYRISNIEERI